MNTKYIWVVLLALGVVGTVRLWRSESEVRSTGTITASSASVAPPSNPKVALSLRLIGNGDGRDLGLLTPDQEVQALASAIGFQLFMQKQLGGQFPLLISNLAATDFLRGNLVQGFKLLQENEPRIVDGELRDRWGSPYFFHQISSSCLELRSAGFDGLMYTTDDLIAATGLRPEKETTTMR